MVKPKKKKEKREKKEKKKRKKPEKRSRKVKAEAEEWKMPGKAPKSKSTKGGAAAPGKRGPGKKSNKNKYVKYCDYSQSNAITLKVIRLLRGYSFKVIQLLPYPGLRSSIQVKTFMIKYAV